MKKMFVLPSLLLVGGCCWGNDPPVWALEGPFRMSSGEQDWDLSEWVEDEKPQKLDFFVTSSDANITASIIDSTLTLSTSSSWEGEGYLDLTVIDCCDVEDVVTALVQVGDGEGEGC